MTASDRIGYALGYAASALGVGIIACGITLFWGSFRNVLCAPILIAMGATVYVLGRWQVYVMRQETR